MFQPNISLNVDFMAIKSQKAHKIGHILVCNFCPIVVTKKAPHPTFLNIFASNFEYGFLTTFGEILAKSPKNLAHSFQKCAKIEIKKSKHIVNCQI